ncbi:MAG: RNA polymerase sigma factor [Acidimicrobiales bacterium]|nr:RNA polymerase sigma factor [Acidimicrobiales bacterium]
MTATRVDEAGNQAFPGGLEPGAFHLVYEQHRRAVHAAASRLAWSGGLAEDLTQEVFLQLWRQPERYDPSRGSLRTFLLTVTRNLAIDKLRSDVARRAREQQDAARPKVLSTADEPDHGLLLAERRATIGRALGDLPEAERDAVVMAYYGGRTYREAAVLLGVPEGTVKSRIRRGLGRMHETLAQQTSPLSVAVS